MEYEIRRPRTCLTCGFSSCAQCYDSYFVKWEAPSSSSSSSSSSSPQSSRPRRRGKGDVVAQRRRRVLRKRLLRDSGGDFDLQSLAAGGNEAAIELLGLQVPPPAIPSPSCLAGRDNRRVPPLQPDPLPHDPCREYMAGRCQEGGRCRNAHPEDEPAQDRDWVSDNPFSALAKTI